MIDHNRDHIGGQQDHDDNLVSSRITKVGQKPVHRRDPGLGRKLPLDGHISGPYQSAHNVAL